MWITKTFQGSTKLLREWKSSSATCQWQEIKSMQEQKFKDKWGIKLFIRTALNTWEVNLTYKQELLCLNHIKSSWRRLPSSTQKSLDLWSFPYIINILRSHLQLVLDIHWKNLSYWVTESLSSRLHTCGCTKAG